MAKKLTLLGGIVFFTYAMLVQLNDPDWLPWMVLYSLCILSGLRQFINRPLNSGILYGLSVLYFILALLTAFRVWDIASPHRDNMLSSEHWLECGGLSLCGIWMIVLVIFGSRTSNSKAAERQ